MIDSDWPIYLKIGELLSEAKDLLDVQLVPLEHPRLKELADEINDLFTCLSPEEQDENTRQKFADRVSMFTRGGSL